MTIGLLLDPYGEKQPGGLGRAVYELARAMLAAAPAHQFSVYLKSAPKEPLSLPGANWKVVPLESRYLWLTGASRIERGLDAYFFSTPVIPLFFRPKNAVVLALDFAYLELPSRTLGEMLGKQLLFLIHLRSLRLATKVVAISEATRQATIRHFGIAPEKVVTVPIGYIAPTATPEPLDTPERFFLFAGVLKERKNVLRVVEAFAMLRKEHPDIFLLIAGKTGGAYYEAVRVKVAELGVEDSVRFAGYVSDGALAYLYGKAEALVFPSLIEGFGMPVLEAMHAGLPVITSNDGSLAEVAGDAALLVDPRSAVSIKRGMEIIAGSPGLRLELIEKGKRRALEFSWERAATGVLRELNAKASP